MKQQCILLILIVFFSPYAHANEIFNTTTTTTTTTPLMDCVLYIFTSPSQGGTTSPRPGSYFIQGCTPETVKAIPNTGFKFSHWEGGDSFISYDNPITIDFFVDPGFIVAVFDKLGDSTNIRLIGRYSCSANPCITNSCPYNQGVIWSVICQNDIYYLTKDWE